MVGVDVCLAAINLIELGLQEEGFLPNIESSVAEDCAAGHSADVSSDWGASQQCGA